MKTILITAYAVNPYKGSEEGTGWNLTCQVARYHKVIAVTRKNNRACIEQYITEDSGNEQLYKRISFLYFDFPKWMIAWKKGPLLSALYFYMWQFGVVIFLMRKKVHFDIGHSLNFHSNWTPSFLWILGKPFVWGPVGNHPIIPKQYIQPIYGTPAFLKDRMLGVVKWIFWNLDPFLYICRKKAKKVFCVNSQAAAKLRLPKHKTIFMPAVASEEPYVLPKSGKDHFTIISVGRFVPLKGFDLAIESFAAFYGQLTPEDKNSTSLVLIGSGPEQQRLQNMIDRASLQQAITIKKWMPRTAVIEQFSSAAAYLFPSHEGAGMVVAEALSYGIPVICLDNYGPGEYIHPCSSLKVPMQDYTRTVQLLAEKISTIFSNKVLYEEERRFALKRYKDLFRWDVKGNHFKQTYAEITAPAIKNKRPAKEYQLV
jgi:glycosyltransferase involved in cell wall biosynthesis